MKQFLVLALSVLCGCAAGSHLQPASSAEIAIVGRALRTVEAVSSFSALADSTLNDRNGATPMRHVMLFRAPRDLRIDVLAPGSGYTLQSLLARDGHALLVMPSEKSVYESDDTRLMLARVFSRGLSEREFVHYLIGRSPQDGNSWQVRNDAQHGQLIAEGSNERWQIGPDGHASELSVLEPFHGTEAMHFSYGNWSAQEPALPQTVSVQVPKQNVRFELHFSVQRLNQLISDKKFEYEIPEGFSRKTLGIESTP